MTLNRDTQPLSDDPIVAVVQALNTAHAREVELLNEKARREQQEAVERATAPLNKVIAAQSQEISFVLTINAVQAHVITELKKRNSFYRHWAGEIIAALLLLLVIACITAYAFYLRAEALRPPVTAQIYMPVMGEGVPLHQVTPPVLTPAQEDDLAIVRAERQSEDYPLGFTAPAELPLGKTLYYMGSNVLRWRIPHRMAGYRVGQLRWMYEESVRVVVHTGNCNFSQTTSPEQGRAYYIIRAAGIPGGSKALLLTDDPSCAVRDLKELTK